MEFIALVDAEQRKDALDIAEVHAALMSVPLTSPTDCMISTSGSVSLEVVALEAQKLKV